VHKEFCELNFPQFYEIGGFCKAKIDFIRKVFILLKMSYILTFIMFFSMLEEAKKQLERALHHLEIEFGKIQMGRANPAIVEDIRIEQYGSLQALKNCASINTLDSQTLSINPWDKSIIHAIAKAITDAGVGLNPQTMGDGVIIKIPPLTEERRRDMTKIVGKFAEEAKISIRNIRSEALKEIKKQETSKEISEDIAKKYESDLQKMIDDANKKIEESAKKKEADVMKV